MLAAGGHDFGLDVVTALYVAVVTDTGSFRYANSTPRAHELAAAYIARGVDPEAIHRRIYATLTRRQLEILQAARNLAGTEVAVFLKELGDGRVKVSLRSNGDVNVARVAHAIGGGGHEKAAGAEVPGSLEEVAERVRAGLARAFPGS